MDFCCGNKQYPDRVLCGGKATLPNKQIIHGTGCKDPSKYISWDGIHYTEAANQLVANQIIRRLALLLLCMHGRSTLSDIPEINYIRYLYFH